MQGNGHTRVSKGKNYERKVAKELSNAFKTDVERTGGSGAYRGIQTEYNQSEEAGKVGFVGDLFFPNDHPLSIFNYELKNHDKVRLTNIFNNSGEIPSFLEQVITDSNRLGGVGATAPCLIIHVTREDDYVVFPYNASVYSDLVTKGPVMIKVMGFYQKRTGLTYRYQMLITNLNTFEQVNPEQIQQVYSKLDWDVLNHDLKPVNHEVDYDDLVDNIK